LVVAQGHDVGEAVQDADVTLEAHEHRRGGALLVEDAEPGAGLDEVREGRGAVVVRRLNRSVVGDVDGGDRLRGRRARGTGGAGGSGRAGEARGTRGTGRAGQADGTLRPD